MHQLTVFEMEEISGGALTDTYRYRHLGRKEVGAIALGPLWALFFIQRTPDVGVARAAVSSVSAQSARAWG